MARSPRTPPPWLISGIERVRSGLSFLHRSTVPANIALLELGFGAWLTQALCAAARLGIADALSAGPLTADEVARRVGTDPGATYRLMRALASRGVFRLRRDGRFALTPMGRALRSDADGSMAPMLRLIGSPEHWQHWSDLAYSVQTGRTAVEKQRGTPIFEYLQTNPEYAAIFNDAMTGVSSLATEAAVPLYDFSDRRLVIDVGGGHGALLAAVLTRAPQANGILYDLPSVVADAGPVLDAAGVSARCAVTDGSFFDSVPDGGDAYLLKSIIHDWDDESSLTILRNVRAAMAADAKVLLFEMVLPQGAPPHPGMLLDLEMLVHAGGRERTAQQYAELLSRAGLRMTRVIPTAGPASIVEAVAAS
ncbi:MAG: hydroxyneurosporene methyltransferase [Mycobacterium sp.]|nr:hydroxyneurosporene methyltransferase [Mycobacterium sp.]